MRALVTDGPGQLACVERAVPGAREGEVLIAFEAGLFTAGTRRAILGNAAQVVEGGFPYPLTIGGAALGRVIDGGGSRRFTKGDRVLVSNVVTCGTCRHCRGGADNLCEHRLLAGIECEGTFAQVIRAAERRVFPVAGDADRRLAVLATEVAVLVNALAMGWEATENRDRVSVIGAGSLGIHAVWLARRWGATEVHVTDPRPDRRDLARRLGADVAMAPDEYDAWVNAGLRDRGAGVALVVTDHADAIAQGCRALRARGCVVCVGLPEGDQALVPRYYPDLLAKELVLRGCYAKSSAHIARALELVRGDGVPALEEYVDIPISEAGADSLVRLAGIWPDGRRHVVTDG
jgi:D-arabinose 1-dehydrogenase-like Zn-dependent alcohol dehydrogenase